MKCPRCNSSTEMVDETMTTQTFVCKSCYMKITCEDEIFCVNCNKHIEEDWFKNSNNFKEICPFSSILKGQVHKIFEKGFIQEED